MRYSDNTVKFYQYPFSSFCVEVEQTLIFTSFRIYNITN